MAAIWVDRCGEDILLEALTLVQKGIKVNLKVVNVDFAADLQLLLPHPNNFLGLHRMVSEMREYPVSGSCVKRNAWLTSGLRGG